jgi:hypothetical protein
MLSQFQGGNIICDTVCNDEPNIVFHIQSPTQQMVLKEYLYIVYK